MIPYHVYKVIHLVGIFTILLALGGVALHVINGGTRLYQARRWAATFHGVGLLLALIGGFGLLARLGIHSWPLWVILKLVVWLALGALPVFFYRSSGKPSSSKGLWLTTLVLAGLAAGLAIYKPGSYGASSTDTPAVTEPATSETAPNPAGE